MKPLEHYVALCRTLTEAEFIARYPGPFLVHSSRDGGPLTPAAVGRTLDGLVLPEDLGEGFTSDMITVFSPSAYAQRGGPYGVGSDGRSALRIAAASVSRSHAIIRQVGAGWAIEDVGSATGTWVNGVALEPRAPRPVGAGDRVALGVLDLTFLTAPAFHAFALRPRP
jgi:hypothetical protein